MWKDTHGHGDFAFDRQVGAFRVTFPLGPRAKMRSAIPIALPKEALHFSRLTRSHVQSVFISHTSADSEFAQRLVGDLRRAGYGARSFRDVVLQGEQLSESRLDRRLGGAIAKDTFFVPVLSPAAVKSRWVDDELVAAIESESKGDQVKIIPALKDECLLPPLLGLRSPADFTVTYEAGLHDLLAMLSPSEDGVASVGVDLGIAGQDAPLRGILAQLSQKPESLSKISAKQFEEVVTRLLERHGYTVRLSHRSRDGGMDLVLLGVWTRKDEPILLQCKRYSPNQQLCLEQVKTLVTSTLQSRVSHASMVTTAKCLDYYHSKSPLITNRRLWRSRCTVEMDRAGWRGLFSWMAESEGLTRQLDRRLTLARERHAQLVDLLFTSAGEPAVKNELAELEVLLDAADASFYEPIKQRLSALRDRLTSEKSDQGPEER